MSSNSLLSGERLDKYKKVSRQNIVFMVVVIVNAILLDYFIFELDWLSMVALGALILIVYRVSRSETLYQLRLKEIVYSKKQSQKALNELQKAANKRKK